MDPLDVVIQDFEPLAALFLERQLSLPSVVDVRITSPLDEVLWAARFRPLGNILQTLETFPSRTQSRYITNFCKRRAGIEYR